MVTSETTQTGSKLPQSLLKEIYLRDKVAKNHQPGLRLFPDKEAPLVKKNWREGQHRLKGVCPESTWCTMAFAARLAELQAQASCPLCLDYLRHPVTLDCGHNFCGCCIQQRWADLQDVLPCPVCLGHCAARSPRRNTQLRHVVDCVRQLPAQRAPGQEGGPCCSACPDHQHHALTPLEPAAARHRRRLKSCLALLKSQLEEAERGREMHISKSIELTWKMENCKQELLPEFEGLQAVLKNEQVSAQARMLIEEKIVDKKVPENKSQMVTHLCALENLLTATAEQCLRGDLGLLTSVKRLHDSTFQADLRLDPDKAHPGLLVSEDRRSVTLTATPPDCLGGARGRLSYPGVQSREGFNAGRHFWQVEARGTGLWSLGVSRASSGTKAARSLCLSPASWQFQPSLQQKTVLTEWREGAGVEANWQVEGISVTRSTGTEEPWSVLTSMQEGIMWEQQRELRIIKMMCKVQSSIQFAMAMTPSVHIQNIRLLPTT
ncbi:Tripartite motif-containing protein 60 [Galemys pyrenaicus]|uniref:Tripartite motif-containing protein 60 n=1 Tax=Galemys pyrenaicus TaxID=202257 RepID=A0A8J6DU38_GALPY|nr:Tripartite motif-containing protein 60 [Galemys pyrenaicus]